MERIFKTKRFFRAILTAVCIITAVLLSACSDPASLENTTEDPVDPISEAPAIQTAEPTAEPDDAYEVPENVIYYNGEETIELPYEPRKGAVKILMLRQTTINAPENADKVFVVLIVFDAEIDDPDYQQRLSQLSGREILERRDSMRQEFLASETAAALYNSWYIYGGDEGIDIVFEQYWEDNATEEEKAMYSDYLAQWGKLYDESRYADVYRAEAERLRSEGLNVHYENGRIIGYLTPAQLLDFPASNDYGYYLKWMFDPATTAEYVIAHSGDLPE